MRYVCAEMRSELARRNDDKRAAPVERIGLVDLMFERSMRISYLVGALKIEDDLQ